MKCPHCNVEVHESWQHTFVDANGTAEEASCEAMGCPHCRRLIARTELYRNKQKIGPEKYYFVPQLPNAGNIAPEQVPQPLKDDYWEACAALSVSAKASAALSRRILQTMLKAQGYDSDNLATQIQNALDEQDARKALPSALHSTVDAIRGFGNFSAHPITDKTSLQIIDVEPEEAEWCLSIIEELFDHYYVKPALAEQKKKDLDAKLEAAGKARSK